MDVIVSWLVNPVIYPLMPKGVEHWYGVNKITGHCAVIYPLMPKGVEHSNSYRSRYNWNSCDLSFDAERR